MTEAGQLRVVNLGLPKTGTTTLSRALKISGFRVADHRIRRRQTPESALHDAFVGDLIYEGYFATGDPAARLPGFDAISEMSCLRDGKSLWPQMDFAVIDALRVHHPGLKFVATRRAAWDVSQSMLAWSDLGLDRLPAGAIPGLPPGFGETSKERETWIEAHYAHLDALFAGDAAYLELDVAAPDARARLASHLGCDIAWWGRANKRKEALS
ncbi:sulfotransferase family protein [Aliishimia ponticola]|uniref:Sulfotransferase family protein n=1 Tax=Aliishimia ponticola TaxID=2499833 RepID=A0A4S4NJE7_9RHOB|nr:sulfotransferase family protein [Aliishimia ponticola]THH38877.1 sulfotransferase family protein [Aliishimia ponticola]